MDETPLPAQPPTDATRSLAVFVAGVAAGEETETWLEALREHGVLLFSHADLEDCVTTQVTRRNLGALCLEVLEHAAGLPLLVLERFPLAVTALTLTAAVIVMITAGHRWNNMAQGR